MKKIILIVLCFGLLGANGQDQQKKGLKFETELTWDQIKQKAKAENKYIFVDVYATWCHPCKQMDNLVYPAKSVGDFMNSRFIAIKIQMDTTKNDLPNIKDWYSTATEFKKLYGVSAYPTYLFFSPHGKLVHRGSGFEMPDDFVKIAGDALDSNKQLYTMIEQYKKGIRNYKQMPELIKNVYNLGDHKLTFEIAEVYNNEFLSKLDNAKLLNKGSIEFVTWNTLLLKPNYRYFTLFYNNAEKVDSVMNEKGFAQTVVDRVISGEEIYPKIFKNRKPIETTPNWPKLERTIQKKYDKAYAYRNIINAKILFYTLKKDWQNAMKFNVEKLDKLGVDTSFWARWNTNNMIFELIFFHSNNREILDKAIKWQYIILQADDFEDATSIDTYANLLYKVGRQREAISWQEKAIQLAPLDKSLSATLEKMKKNLPTWVKE